MKNNNIFITTKYQNIKQPLNAFSIYFFAILSFSLLILSQQSKSSLFTKGLYHTTKEIFSELDDLANGGCDNLMTRNTVTKDGKELIYYEISGRNPESNQKKNVMIFGEHARELISSEQALYLVKVLCKKSNLYNEETVNIITNNVKFVIVPIVNVFGREKVEDGDFCYRANENDVDLNRNWDIHWTSNHQFSDDYPGDHPFSEWQTRAMASLLEDKKPDIFMTTHSGNYGMYTPYAYKKFNLDELPLQDSLRISKMTKILKKINSKYCDCIAGSIGKDLGYLCPGTCLDYAFEHESVKYSFAFEIFDGKSSNPKIKAILEDENLKPFIYQVFQIDQALDDEIFNFKSFVQTKVNLGNKFLKKKSLTNLLQIEKLNYYQEKETRSCFSLIQTKSSSTMDCQKEFNPFTPLSYKNTLINWVNVYFEIISLVLEYEK